MIFRLDRLVTLYLFHPLIKWNALSAKKIPILMYHGICDLKKKNLHPYYETATSPNVFNAQLAFLKENGFQSIRLEDILGILAGTRNAPQKPVVLTFDDGLLDFYETAFSVLDSFDYSATVFLPTGLIGKKLAGQAIMSWNQVRELHEAGIDFGSHSVSHKIMVQMDVDTVIDEIKKSKAKIEDKIGKEVITFSYPYAFPEQDENFIERLEYYLLGSGYRIGVTTTIGRVSRTDNPLFFTRLPINTYDDIHLFQAKLEGGYDWLRKLQTHYKKIFRKTVKIHDHENQKKQSTKT